MDEADKIEQQRRLYGQPLGDLVRQVTGRLGLTQARVADILGLSPAMMSQLVGGHRVKIGNPQAVARLQTLLALADEAPALSGEAVAGRLDEIRASRPGLTTGQMTATTSVDAAEIVRRVLRAVASGRELDAAAQQLHDTAPALAELLRVYGTGTSEEAAHHLQEIAHLL